MANRHISALPKAIESACQTLESLSLTYTSWDAAAEDHASDQNDCDCRISLTNFPKLRNLTLGMVWIFGLQLFHWTSDVKDVSGGLLAQLLPPGLETLQINRGDVENVAPHLTKY